MRFIYGNFQGADTDNWACTGAQKTAVRKNGQLTSIITTLDFQAVIIADGQYLLSQRVAQIQAAILYDGKNVGLLHDNGTPSKLFLDSSQSQSGVRITRYPFPEPNIAGADYASSVTIRCSFEAEYSGVPIGGGGGQTPPNVLVSFTESLAITGDGGPRTAVQEYIKGDPEQFTLADKTAVRATQSGSAVVEGFSGNSFASVSEPLFPGLLKRDSKGERRVVNQLTDGKWSCSIDWEYQFESTGPIDGTVFAAPQGI